MSSTPPPTEGATLVLPGGPGPAQPGPPSGPGTGGETLSSGPVPRRTPGAGVLGLVLALLLLALGLLLVYEGTVLLGWVEGDPLVTDLLGREAVITPDTVTAAVAGLVALVGLWLLWTAVRPARRRGIALATSTGVWMTHRDLERLVAGTAEDVDGVLDASASVGRRRAVVAVATTSPAVRDHVQAAVTERLSALSAPPTVVVHDNPKREGGAR